MTRGHWVLHWGLRVIGGMLLAMPAVAFCWGFTVDDALVAARVAHHWSLGRGYGYNPNGPVVDAVTPFGWVVFLVPFAKHGVWPAFEAARWVGIAAWLGAVSVTVRVVSKTVPGRGRFWALALLAISTPPAAWASSGMETGVVALLGALSLQRMSAARWAAGMAAAWRPELLPWAVVMVLGNVWVDSFPEREPNRRPWRLLAALPTVLAPAAVVATLRCLVFGSPAPLAVVAKPPDLAYGAWYVAAGLVWAGPVWLLAAGRAWAEVTPRDRVVGLALFAHAGAMCLAGGDWMPLFRLWVPVWPSMTVLGAALCGRGRPWTNAVRFSLGAAASLSVALTTALQGREVVNARRDWSAALSPQLSAGDVVATLDVGWVGAATQGEVVDFAGITDPSVAYLPGPHHAKRIDRGFLERRRVNVLVLLLARDQGARLEGETPRYSRTVEERLQLQTGFEAFREVGEVQSAGGDARYLVLRRAPR